MKAVYAAQLSAVSVIESEEKPEAKYIKKVIVMAVSYYIKYEIES